MLALKEKGIDIDNGFQKIPVTANDASVMAVYKGDAEVGFSFWDAHAREEGHPRRGPEGRRLRPQRPDPQRRRRRLVEALAGAAGQDHPGAGVLLNTDEGSKVLKSIYSITKLAPANPASLDVVARAAQQLGLQ
jgi:phosphonate transport system substrate-binding protein